MGLFFAYSLQSALCLTLFYLFYKVLLSKETFHHFNRFLLIGMIVLAAGIPFAGAFFSRSAFMIENPVKLVLDTGEITTALSSETVQEKTGSSKYRLFFLLLTYVAGCTLCLFRCGFGIIRIWRIIRRGKRQKAAGNTYIIVHNEKQIAPFSWMNYIVISQKDKEEAGETIILHELAHIRLHHSIDLFFAEACIIFQWYNPAVWLLYNELQTIHEFEADQSVLNQGINAKQYQLLLIKKAVGTRLYSMANSFNHSNLKKRITMMLQKKSNSWARLKYAYVLPLTAIAIAVFARPEVSQSFDEISSVKVSDFIQKTESTETENQPIAAPPPPAKVTVPIANGSPETAPQPIRSDSKPAEMPPPVREASLPIEQISEKNTVTTDTTVYNVVDHMPEFPGGIDALMDFLAKNIVYPKSMQEAGIEGRVIVSFIISKDGTIYNAKVVSGLCPEGDTEALRIVSIMPKWKPGKLKGKTVNTKYTLPMNYKLQN